MNRAVLLLAFLVPMASLARNPIERPSDERPEVEAALSWAPPAAEKPSPMRLTASDGTGLRLLSVEADAIVSDPLAFTELKLTFENPEARVREGRFEITLPDGAAISRFAMKIDGQWQEGEILEKQHARRIYEDFLHQRQDPALLEKDAGNQFRARVFPIPAGGVKELIISYSQELTDADEPWRLPLQGLPMLDTLDVSVSLDAHTQTPSLHTVHKEHHLPGQDLTLALFEGQTNVGLRSGAHAVARVRPRLHTRDADIDGLTVLVDTSASRVLGFEAQVERLTGIMAAVASEEGNIPVQVFAYDQTMEAIYDGRIRDFPTAAARLTQREALGASDLSMALEGLQDARVHDRLLLVTDGIFTAGDTDAEGLHPALIALSLERLDVLVDGGIRDEDALSGLVTAGLKQDGLVIESSSAPQDVARRLTRATASGIDVDVPGAEWFWPTVLDGVQSGDDQLIYAKMADGRPMQVTMDGAVVEQPIRFAETAGPLLQRSAVKANIDRLTAMHSASVDEEKDTLYNTIVELSQEHRVLSDFTAMLVLETEEDYQRYEIDRDSLSDILTVQDGQLQLLTRRDWVVPEDGRLQKPQPIQAQEADGDAMHGERITEDLDDDIPDPSPVAGEDAIGLAAGISARSAARREQSISMAPLSVEQEEDEEEPTMLSVDPWEGRFKEVMDLIASDQLEPARAAARGWWVDSPGDVLALLALGEALEALGEDEKAARVYGSIIDLFPSRADMRRMAGQRLDRLDGVAAGLALDTYRVAVAQRPDHPASHRLYAWSLAREGIYEEAFAAIEVGLDQAYPAGRFSGVGQILRDDLAIIGQALSRADRSQAQRVAAALQQRGISPVSTQGTRMLLHWETDANDVDLHVFDGDNNHAWYQSKEMPSGGQLHADVTTGFGPECFAVSDPDAFPYRIQAHYYSRGPMGYGMGSLQIITHDGRGGLTFDDRPFVIMKDQATVDLGTLAGPTMGSHR